MEQKKQEIEAILNAEKSLTPETGKKILGAVSEALKCPWCEWQGNEGRHQPANLSLIREYLDDWVVASHLHWMKHNFWNNFPHKTKFVKKEHWENHKAATDYFLSVQQRLRKNPPIIEISEEEETSSE
jgi:hypothetical protein